MGFRPIGLGVLTVWASIRDPASIGDRRLFETRRLIEVLRYDIWILRAIVRVYEIFCVECAHVCLICHVCDFLVSHV